MWLYTSLVFLQADYERRLLQLCREGCKADITWFREILQRGVDVNIYNEVSVHVHQKYIGKSTQLLYTV